MPGTRSLPGEGAGWRRLARRGAAFARAGAVIAMVLIVATALLARSAEARAGEVLLGFGRDLASWTEGQPQSVPRVLSLNGLNLDLMTVTTRLDVQSALDHFHDLCRQRGGLQQDSAALPSWPDLVLRKDAAHEGMLACLDTGGPLGLAQLTERLGRLSESGNLADLGQLRYVLARRSGDTTTLLVLWTDRDAQLFGLIPAEGDAAGTDPKDFPRAPGMRRLLSAAEQGATYRLSVYDAANQPAAALLAWYEAELVRKGWSVARTGDRLIAQIGNRTVIVAIRARNSSTTVVSIAELA